MSRSQLRLVLTLAQPPARAGDLPLAADTQHGKVRVVTVSEGLEHPWGMAFLPDGRALVTERPGRLRLVGTDGKPGVLRLYNAGGKQDANCAQF